MLCKVCLMKTKQEKRWTLEIGAKTIPFSSISFWQTITFWNNSYHLHSKYYTHTLNLLYFYYSLDLKYMAAYPSRALSNSSLSRPYTSFFTYYLWL